MGYRLRLPSEIRDWLADLLGTEPELGRLVGEAVVALLDGGERLGPLDPDHVRAGQQRCRIGHVRPIADWAPGYPAGADAVVTCPHPQVRLIIWYSVTVVTDLAV